MICHHDLFAISRHPNTDKVYIQGPLWGNNDLTSVMRFSADLEGFYSFYLY